ncbi:hypothetical protein N7491_009325 [Penicillium cf. griseofulvum]|uniref:Uncharacterized protein n=1 Tax=Penicillium cf. griseofulvum TaxID=2972120 RepID=A0A9W9JMU3_9EURO|nr:hypothetical protein N7472_005082 [Penicillium cf. griseofulvum]KAJ5424109.1 hypothetical protein N7491_009325 [Penicillium cf. griseofulvum]
MDISYRTPHLLDNPPLATGVWASQQDRYHQNRIEPWRVRIDADSNDAIIMASNPEFHVPPTNAHRHSVPSPSTGSDCRGTTYVKIPTAHGVKIMVI